MTRFADALETLGRTSAPQAGPLDIVLLGGRVGLGIALGSAAALIGLLAWLFA
jgi:hypothetical protein